MALFIILKCHEDQGLSAGTTSSELFSKRLPDYHAPRFSLGWFPHVACTQRWWRRTSYT